MTAASMGGTEYVLSRSPFVVRRHVSWSDCDPAGVVFTGRFSDYLLGAVILFMRELADGSWHRYVDSLGIDTPCKGMTFEFSHALWPDDEVDITVEVGEIRSRSFDMVITARRAEGTIAFTGTFSPVCIAQGERRAVAIPDALRARLDSYRRNEPGNRSMQQ